MAVAAGIGGLVKNGANTVANLNNWSFSAKGNTANTTAFQATGSWENYTATTKSWTAKADGFTDGVDTNGQVALFNGLNSTFTVEFDIDGTHHWSGSAILIGIDPKASATGMNEVSLSFQGNGALSYT